MASKTIATQTPLKIDGTLYLNPTDTDNAPSGLGTPLGYQDNLAVLMSTKVLEITNQMNGYPNMRETIFRRVVIAAYQRNFDSDLLPLLFDGTNTDTDSGKPLAGDNLGSAIRLLEKNTNRILIYPKEPEIQPAFILFSATAELDESSESPYQKNKDFGKKVIFQGLVEPASTRRIWNWGLAQDIKI